MKTGYAVFGFVVVGALAFYVGYEAGKGQGGAPGNPTVANRIEPNKMLKPNVPVKKAEGEDASIFNIAVGAAACKGPADAKVTIIEFSDFECPFCSRVNPTIKQVQDEFGNDVRICFKHNPLPFHQAAPLASEATLAAHEQGKFWEMHDKLFANQKALGREALEGYAQELGLDMGKFKAALDNGTFKAQIEGDKAEAARFGARGTPAFFINGAFLSGAQPFPKFKEAIEDGIKRADAVLAKGVAKDRLYAEVVKGGLAKAEAPKPRPQPGEGTGRQLVSVPSHTYCKGPKDAKVTIVEFSDFECPFCSRVVPTADKIMQDYKGDVKFCFRHNPLGFHKNAEPAAQASMAAGDQGKFWEMHDKLFANQKALTRPDLERYAQELGLNMGKFKAALDASAFKGQIAEDQKESARFGARGTPAFFINGIKLSGAQPFERFKAVIDDELKKADEQLKKGTPLAKVYEELVKADPWKPGAEAAPGEPVDDKPVDVDIKGAYVKGASSAKVTIVEFSEFQCPFCARVVPTIEQLLKEYPGKVKVAFKHNPLPFHNNAEAASKAALAAGEQGKFWEMHDKLFANQKALSESDLEGYAKEIGLNVAKFKADLANPKLAAVVSADKAEAAKVGARGTPTFFINGRRLVGAQPVDAFKKIIDEELKKN